MKITEIYNNIDELSVTFNIITKHKTYEVWIKSTHKICSTASIGNALLCGTLIPCMALGEDIQIPCHIDNKLIENTNLIQDVYHTWHPDKLKYIKIDFLESPPEKEPTIFQNTGVFFSGGVDSFYTLLQNKDKISHIIYVHGFDIPLKDTIRRESITKTLNNVSTSLGVQLIEIETNLREFSDDLCCWGQYYHGSALAMIAHMLLPTITRMFISTGFTYRYLEPWGDHILNMPQWNSKDSDFVLYGMTASRTKKCEFIAKHEVTQRNLRVCWEHKNNNYNCGECEKCLRTMTTLFIFEKLEKFDVFPQNYSINKINNIIIKGPVQDFFWREILEIKEPKKPCNKIKHKINTILNRYTAQEIQKNSNTLIINELLKHKKFRENIFIEIVNSYFYWLIVETTKEILKKILFLKRLRDLNIYSLSNLDKDR